MKGARTELLTVTRCAAVTIEAVAGEAVNPVNARAVVETRATRTLVRFDCKQLSIQVMSQYNAGL